jgi:hypothetical protein
MQQSVGLIGTIGIPSLLGDTPTLGVPVLPAITQRLLQETSAWNSIPTAEALLLQVQTTGFSATTGVTPQLSAVEAAHLTHLLQTVRTLNHKTLGLHLEPTNISTAVALWQLGLVDWVMIAPFHQSVLHPVFGFLQPYPLEALCQQWQIPLTAQQPAWLVINLHHWRLDAIVHHWHYLMAHPWIKAVQLTPKQASYLHEQGVWHQAISTPTSPAIWLLDAPIAWLAENTSWLFSTNITVQLCLHQLALRPLQTTDFWPYTTDTTDPRRIEAYQQQLHTQCKLTTNTIPNKVAETTEPSKKCPFGYG